MTDARVSLALLVVVLALIVAAGIAGYGLSLEIAGVVAFALIVAGIVWAWVRREA